MAESLETLIIEPRGLDHALVRIDQHGARTEMVLSEANIGSLCRLVPRHFRKILAAKTAAIPGVKMTISVPIRQVRLNTDIHKLEILLTVIDRFEGEADYSLLPSAARVIAGRLLAKAEEIEAATRNATKQ